MVFTVYEEKLVNTINPCKTRLCFNHSNITANYCRLDRENAYTAKEKGWGYGLGVRSRLSSIETMLQLN